MLPIRRAPLVGIAMLVAASLVAQVEVPRHTEFVEVRITNVDVVVTDRDGKRVHGLTKEDFELFDAGQKQEITNLSEIAGAPATSALAPASTDTPATAVPAALSEPPPRRVVIFYDSSTSSSQERQRVTPAILDFIKTVRPVDEVMIVSWNRRLTIAVPPTSDREKLIAGLDRVSKEISLMSPGLSAFADLTGLEDISAMMGTGSAARAERSLNARRAIREASSDLRESARALQGIFSRLAGLEGRKALILVSSGFSFRPGSDATVEEDAILTMEDWQGQTLIESVARAANAAGVTIYAIHAAGLTSGMSAAQSTPQESLNAMQRTSNSIDGLAYLSAQTGGLLAANMNGYRRAVERITEDLNSYYSIGYRAPTERTDRERKLVIRARNRNYSVRFRRSLIDRSFATEVTDSVLAGVMFPSARTNELGITAVTPSSGQRKWKGISVPVDVRIPMAGLTYQAEDDGTLSAALSIFIASGDAQGGISVVKRFEQKVKVRRDQMASLRNKHYTYGMDVDLRTPSAGNRLSIAVLDNVSKAIGYTTLDVNPPKR